ncbi:HolA DNA polymerase III, delta subunit [Candidatus Pelagibacterales bacterium]
MLLKSQEISLKKKDFFKEKVILLYGENQDLINDLNQQITSKFIEEEKIPKSCFEEDIIKNPENIISYYLNGSLFDDNKNISIIKNCSDKILDIINKIKNNINDNIIILNSEVLLKNSKLRQFGEYDKLAICVPCYQETKFDIKKFLTQQLQVNNIQLSDSQSETIIVSSSLKRSKIKEVIEKINLYKNSEKITDQIIDEICTDADLKKNDEIIDILLSKNEKNINDFISNMSNYEKNFIEIIIILRSFIIKILDIQKNNKNLSIDERIERYKPPIFWKDKDRIKNILKIWNTNNLEKFLSNLNIIETEFKRNDLNQDTQFYYFLTQNLSKIAFKNTNNFI